MVQYETQEFADQSQVHLLKNRFVDQTPFKKSPIREQEGKEER